MAGTEWRRCDDVRRVGDHARRYRNPFAKGEPPPFPAYVAEPDEQADADEGAIAPDFTMFGERPVIRLHAAFDADLYGLGEVCGSLRLNGRRIVGSTKDAFNYSDRSDRLYQAHPWVFGLRPNGDAFGVILETTYPFVAELEGMLLLSCDGPPPAVTVIEAPTPAGVMAQLAELTGHMPMPPRWALGFQQSKWSYEPASRVLEVAQEFRDRRLPADVIWVDIDYMDQFKIFTFDDETFPDPAGLVDDLHEIGWRSAWMIDPGVFAQPGYFVYDEGMAGNHFVKTPEGEPFEGVVWPPVVSWPDFTQAATRDWFGAYYQDFLATGIDAVWNDMNEPVSIEDVPDKALPPNLRHEADDDLGGPGDHHRYRNIYGMQMTRSSRDGMMAARPDARPFLLTRSTFLGGHRYAATWTGDNESAWEDLAWSIPMILNLGLSGQPLVGPDIGGFAGQCDGRLLARWMGIGALFPFSRNHSMKMTPDQEPWHFGPEVEATCRRALERRYRLLPYLYTLAREASATGAPIMRPAFWADHTDQSLRWVDDAFMLGNDLYVVASVHADGRAPSAPPSGWTQILLLDDDAEASDPDLPSLFLRPGAILPLGPVMQFSDERPLDELELVVAPDSAGEASGLLYEDDGDGHAYDDGSYRLTRFSWSGGEVQSAIVDGDWSAGEWALRPRTV